MQNTYFYALVTKFSTSSISWKDFIGLTGLVNLNEVVSVDNILCPSLIEVLTPEDWSHNVHDDFRTYFFWDIKYLIKRAMDFPTGNLLALLEDPMRSGIGTRHFGVGVLPSCEGFVFKGYDIVDEDYHASLLTNCGGFPDVFQGTELNSCGLIERQSRAYEIKIDLMKKHYDNPHTKCIVLAVWRNEQVSFGQTIETPR